MRMCTCMCMCTCVRARVCMMVCACMCMCMCMIVCVCVCVCASRTRTCTCVCVCVCVCASRTCTCTCVCVCVWQCMACACRSIEYAEYAYVICVRRKHAHACACGEHADNGGFVPPSPPRMPWPDRHVHLCYLYWSEKDRHRLCISGIFPGQRPSSSPGQRPFASPRYSCNSVAIFFAEAIGEFGQVHTAHARVLRPFAILIPLVVIKACDQPALHAEPQSLKR